MKETPTLQVNEYGRRKAERFRQHFNLSVSPEATPWHVATSAMKELTQRLLEQETDFQDPDQVLIAIAAAVESGDSLDAIGSKLSMANLYHLQGLATGPAAEGVKRLMDKWNSNFPTYRRRHG